MINDVLNGYVTDSDIKKSIKSLESKIIQIEKEIEEKVDGANLLLKILYFLKVSPYLKKDKRRLFQHKVKLNGLNAALKINKIIKIESAYIQTRMLPVVKEHIMTVDKFLKHKKNYIDPILLTEWSQYKKKLSDLNRWQDGSNTLFIDHEKKKNQQYFHSVESQPLTDRQKEAVIVNEENNLILAGAGSGKTSVIIAKIGYIIKKKYANPDEILVLAFNKKAQQELSERIKNKLNIEIAAKTFHSYGLQIVSKAIGNKPSLCKWAEDEKKFAPLIRSMIIEKLERSDEFYKTFSKYFISYFAPYKAREEFKTLGEYYEYIRNFNIRTFKDELVKSFEECEIANQLFMWNIDYIYEGDYKYDTKTVDYRQYKPDFYLPEYDIYIEHFGVSRDGHTRDDIDEAKYLADMEWKRNLHCRKATKLIETYSYEKNEGILLSGLKDKLLSQGVVIGSRSVSEALETFNKHSKIDKFSKLVITFMGHYQSNQYKMEDLRKKILEEREEAFLDVFQPIYESYKFKKMECDCIDFNDMIVQAVEFVKSNRYTSNYKYILVDEFQDISAGRSKLIHAIREQVENSNVTVVGDDWQSINRFAGGDISIIQSFQKNFGHTRTVNLDYTFRFNDKVSKTATNFVIKNPKQIKKEIKTIKKSKTPSIYVFWYEDKGEEVKSIEKVLSIIDNNTKKDLEKKTTIKFLARYNMKKPDNFHLIQSRYAQYFDITFSSVHGSKGLEADYIVLLSLEQGEYGFPSKIEDDPLIDFIMPDGDDYPDAEERRLFYVALTRTKDKVFILANKTSVSPFVKELLEDNTKDIYQVGYDYSEVQHCPKCKTGTLVKRKGEEHWFYGCSNYPYCDYTDTIMICPKCNKFEVKKDIEHHIAKCTDKGCTGFYKLCKKCDNYLVVRNGKYGKFLGCKSYPKCIYTEKIQ